MNALMYIAQEGIRIILCLIFGFISIRCLIIGQYLLFIVYGIIAVLIYLYLWRSEKNGL